ncbi:MAG: glycosyltransferase family 1 protein, partial [Candidatus Micrarchaeaceae archaeon]
MKIVIDLQGAQSESRFRDIGRYAMAITKAIIKNKSDEDEIILALNGLFQDTIEPIRAEFDELLPQENIRVWSAPGPLKACEQGNDYRRDIAERIREAFLASLNPDIILVASLFEGYVDDAATSIGILEKIPTAVILYDLIPYADQKNYLDNNPLYKKHYLKKIEYLKKADLLLAISDYSKQEAVELLGFDEQKIESIYAACEDFFKKINISNSDKENLLSKLNITKDFILYTGGENNRKNLSSLIKAFSMLEKNIRRTHQIVIAGRFPDGNIKELQNLAKETGLEKSELIFTGYISDDELVKLYNLCKLFVLPSFREDFGLPLLEAMACGAATITSNTTSLSEVAGRGDMLFDPYSVESIVRKMQEVLSDEGFRKDLIQYGLNRAKEFSLDKSAKLALEALRKL